MNEPQFSDTYIKASVFRPPGPEKLARLNASTVKQGEALPRDLTVQDVAASTLHKDAEFAKRVLEDEVYWWLTYAILFENCLKVQGYTITPRSDFSRRNMAIGAWIAEHENDFVLTDTPAVRSEAPLAPIPIRIEEMGEFYELLQDE
jgi:hypothetical protein